ncbi:DNA-directed RNA polymerase I subunit RPA12 isoform X1 [Mustela putorius furo]|uniref:DNA-directed RNA polymerase I subunit RPA12 isoform X1 n=1 Tax=Mustela putorius furo TaxID=9669 RepID=A0A8U0RS05_MUSPF|nr:DNA-directed RNA polymerase I subunit RPA12 isoform X1 [Mustela putorius furo]
MPAGSWCRVPCFAAMPLTRSELGLTVRVCPGHRDAWAGGALRPLDLGSEIRGAAARVSSARPAGPGPAPHRTRPRPAASQPLRSAGPRHPPSLPLGHWQVLLRDGSAGGPGSPSRPRRRSGPCRVPPARPQPTGRGSWARSADSPSRRRHLHRPGARRPPRDRSRPRSRRVHLPLRSEPHSHERPRTPGRRCVGLSGGARCTLRAPRHALQPRPRAAPRPQPLRTAPPAAPPLRVRLLPALRAASVNSGAASCGACAPSRDGGTTLATRALRRL